MKKLLIAFSLFIFSFSFITAQSFQKGSLIVSATYGFDAYSVQMNEINNYSNPPQSVSSNNGAASGNVNIGGEYGVTNWLGLGLQFKLDSYLHRADVTQANGFEGGLIVNAHIIRHTHFDLLAGLDLGASSLTITWNDGYNDQIYGGGSWFDIHFTARIYVGRFGFSATWYIPTINYANLTSNNSTFNQYILASWKAKGDGLNIGIQYHFLQ